MRTIVTALLFAACLGFAQDKAQDKKAAVAGVKPLSRETQLEIQNIALQEEKANDLIKQLSALLSAPLQQKRVELFTRVCGEVGVDVKDCAIDAEKNTVSKRLTTPGSNAPKAK